MPVGEYWVEMKTTKIIKPNNSTANRTLTFCLANITGNKGLWMGCFDILSGLCSQSTNNNQHIGGAQIKGNILVGPHLRTFCVHGKRQFVIGIFTFIKKFEYDFWNDVAPWILTYDVFEKINVGGSAITTCIQWGLLHFSLEPNAHAAEAYGIEWLRQHSAAQLLKT